MAQFKNIFTQQIVIRTVLLTIFILTAPLKEELPEFFFEKVLLVLQLDRLELNKLS